MTFGSRNTQLGGLVAESGSDIARYSAKIACGSRELTSVLLATVLGIFDLDIELMV